MRTSGASDRGRLIRLFVLAALSLLTMTALTRGAVLSSATVESIAFQFPELGLLSFAMLLPMLTGGIDLSIVSVANLSGIAAAVVMTRMPPGTAQPVAIAAGIAAALACGMVCGVANGVLVGRVCVSPVLATLGTMQLFFGAAVVWTGGQAVIGLPESLQHAGNGSLGVVPIPLVLFATAAVIVSVLSNRTVFGLESRLVGSNAIAGRFSGIAVPSVLVRTYVASGVIASVTGVLMVAHANSAKADYGSSYLLQSILVVVLGGVSPSGGSGRVLGVTVAVVALQFLSAGFSMLHLSSFAKDLAWGGFLLIVMIANWYFDEDLR